MKGDFHARERPFCHFVRFVRTRQRREPHWPGGVFALACGYDPLARGCGRACPQAWHIGLWMWSCLPAGMAILACGRGHVDPRAWSRWSDGHSHIGLVGVVALTGGMRGACSYGGLLQGLYGHGSPRGALRPKRLAKGFVVAAARGSFVLERAGGYGQELGVCAAGVLDGVLVAR